jgi:hypothetical protein
MTTSVKMIYNDITQAFEILQNVTVAKKEESSKRVNEFPYGALPYALQEIICDYKDTLKLKGEFLAAAMLAVAGAVIGRKRLIQLTKYPQHASLYMALIGESNAGKSPAIRFAMQPLKERQRIDEDAYQAAKREYKAALKQYESSKGDEPEPTPPRQKIHYTTDATLEGLHEIMLHNPNGTLLERHELIGFFKDFNKYRKGSDEEAYIQMYDGEDVPLKRTGKDQLFIYNPALTILGGLQPEKLEEIPKSSVDNGLMNRFLCVFPETTPKEHSDEPMSPTHTQTWGNAINKLLAISENYTASGHLLPSYLHLNKTSKELYSNFTKTLTNECNKPQNAPYKGSLGKLDMTVGRLALIIELLDFACSSSSYTQPPNEISARSMQSAITLCEYFKEQQKKMLARILGIDLPLDSVEVKMLSALPNPPETFGRGEIQNIAKILGLSELYKYPNQVSRFIDKLSKAGVIEKVNRGAYEKL